jgi:hypothetical protein
MDTSPSPVPARATVGSNYVIGLTQFVFFSLGLMVLVILVKVRPGGEEVQPLAEFLVAHGLWFALVPLLWMLLAEGAVRYAGPSARPFVTATGIVLAAAIGGIFATAILWPTS